MILVHGGGFSIVQEDGLARLHKNCFSMLFIYLFIYFYLFFFVMSSLASSFDVTLPSRPSCSAIIFLTLNYINSQHLSYRSLSVALCLHTSISFTCLNAEQSRTHFHI